MENKTYKTDWYDYWGAWPLVLFPIFFGVGTLCSEEGNRLLGLLALLGGPALFILLARYGQRQNHTVTWESDQLIFKLPFFRRIVDMTQVEYAVVVTGDDGPSFQRDIVLQFRNGSRLKVPGYVGLAVFVANVVREYGKVVYIQPSRKYRP